MNDQPLSDVELAWLEERLPWYLNGTLAPAERERMASLLARSPEAAQLLTREQALVQRLQRGARPVPQDLGLAELLEQVQAQRPGQVREAVAPASAARGVKRERATAGYAWRALQSWLAMPSVATAMAALLVAQGAALAWLALRDDDTAASLRSVPVTELRTLRVRFRPGATEAQVRAALTATGARIVGGPTQLGEYWIASDLLPIDKMRPVLMESQIVQSMEADPRGPQGH